MSNYIIGIVSNVYMYDPSGNDDTGYPKQIWKAYFVKDGKNMIQPGFDRDEVIRKAKELATGNVVFSGIVKCEYA